MQKNSQEIAKRILEKIAQNEYWEQPQKPEGGGLSLGNILLGGGLMYGGMRGIPFLRNYLKRMAMQPKQLPLRF